MEYVDGVANEDGSAFTSINAVYLLLTDDENENARLLKSTTKGVKKSLSIKAPVLTADLVKAGILDATKEGNQYLTLVEEQIEGAPEWVKGAYKIVVDETVKASEDSEEEGQDAGKDVANAPTNEQPAGQVSGARNF